VILVDPGEAVTRTVTYDVECATATIVLDRPHRRNAFTVRMRHEICDAIDRACADDDVRVIVITGAGRDFCVGADISGGTHALSEDGRPIEDPTGDTQVRANEGGRVALHLYRSTKPVVAAINGPAVGAGITMMLPADLRIASSDARFGFPFVRLGLVPEACSSWFLPRLVGIDQALDWCLTGRIFDAREALAAGLVSQVVPPDELMAAVRERAAALTGATSAMAVSVARTMMWRMLAAPDPETAHEVDSLASHWIRTTPDAREGVTAFVEKRAPDFTLRVPSDRPALFDWELPPDHEPAG
jgi:enoyl-CoA hydratase/carnithine racemase